MYQLINTRVGGGWGGGGWQAPGAASFEGLGQVFFFGGGFWGGGGWRRTRSTTVDTPACVSVSLCSLLRSLVLDREIDRYVHLYMYHR
jgi:hypothetical protein